MKPLSRTVGENRVVDELIVSFTHDREMRVYLPGVAPTGRKVVLPHAGAPEGPLRAAKVISLQAFPRTWRSGTTIG